MTILSRGNPEIFLEEEATIWSLDTKSLTWAAMACFLCSLSSCTLSQDDLIGAGTQVSHYLCRSPSRPSFLFVPSQLTYFWCLITVLLCRQWRCHPSQKMIVSACSFVPSGRQPAHLIIKRRAVSWQPFQEVLSDAGCHRPYGSPKYRVRLPVRSLPEGYPIKLITFFRPECFA